ncbi:right-handed parallel beta-helix repeat-containing protein [Vibrio fortis]|uniref:right-handed parallel beta-helix repeat-containing protein n=1 Tax=Vibrio fortis TaxID=212667 RepID=UPI0038CDB573
MVNQAIEQLLQEAIDQSMAQTQESRELAEEVAGKMADIDRKVGEALLSSFKPIYGSTTKTIGVGGDYATLREAIEYYSTTKPISKATGATTYTGGVILKILTGTVLGEQILLGPGSDLSFIRIDATDPVVYIDHTKILHSFEGRFPIFGASRGAKLPVINTLFEYQPGGDGNKDGILVSGPGTTAYVYAGKGVRNAPGNGLYALNCAVVHAASADFSNAKNMGVYALYNTTINFSNGVANDCGIHGVYAHRGSTVMAERVEANRAGQNGLFASDGSSVFGYAASVNDAGLIGCQAREASFVNFTLGKANGAGDKGIYAYGGCIIQAHTAEAKDAGNAGVDAYASKINAIGCVATGAAVSGLRASMGSLVVAHSANFQKGESPDSSDVALSVGVSLMATGLFSGGLPFATNTLTSNGIIYQ